MITLSVVLPTHNPNPAILERVLDALRCQSLPIEVWQLLVVDNASSSPLPSTAVSWHPHGCVVREDQLGLTYARLCGLEHSSGNLLVWVDDDNLLEPNYLLSALRTFENNPALGAAGGASIPEFQSPPPSWYVAGLAPLGCRDLGDQEIWMRWDPHLPHYPRAAPIGAGLVIRKQVMKVWANAVAKDHDRLSLGRRGSALSSGEDNDINLTLLRAGWELAYLPQLRLTHVIPASRLKLAYQKRMARSSFRDFIRVLDLHGIRPWPAIPSWSVPLRALRSWFRYRAWSSPAQQVLWSGALGQYEGRALLPR
jgi:glycosyltransferase involved in cell wall biosynthesis